MPQGIREHGVSVSAVGILTLPDLNPQSYRNCHFLYVQCILALTAAGGGGGGGWDGGWGVGCGCG